MARGRLLPALAVLATLTACGAPNLNVRAGGFADGTWTGKSDHDDTGGYGVVRLTIHGNDVTAATFTLYQADGTRKGVDYGKVNGQITDQDEYDRAQAGIAAAPKYAAELVSTDDLSKVDTITGASITYRTFEQAVTNALDQARK